MTERLEVRVAEAFFGQLEGKGGGLEDKIGPPHLFGEPGAVDDGRSVGLGDRTGQR